MTLDGRHLDKITIAAWQPWGVINGKKSEQPLQSLAGVIGLDIFRRLGIVALDYAHRRFILYATPPSTSAPIKKFMLDNAGIFLPVKADGHNYDLFLDTGSNTSIIKRSHLALNIPLQPCKAQESSPPNCALYRPKTFQIGTVTNLQPTILVMSYKRPGGDGILGGNTLRHIYLVLDFRNDTFSAKQPTAPKSSR